MDRCSVYHGIDSVSAKDDAVHVGGVVRYTDVARSCRPVVSIGSERNHTIQMVNM